MIGSAPEVSRRSALLTLTFLAAGEREDLWHPGYPNSGNLEELECLQTENDQLYDSITQGAIIRSRATWYEMGEKKQQIFFEF